MGFNSAFKGLMSNFLRETTYALAIKLEIRWR